MGQSHGWGWLGPLLRWKSRGCWGDQVIWGLGVPFELTGCWRNLVPCLEGLRATFSYRLSADSCSQPLMAPCHTLPCGPLHHTAVCFFKTSRRISLFIWLRGSFLESSQKRQSHHTRRRWAPWGPSETSACHSGQQCEEERMAKNTVVGYGCRGALCVCWNVRTSSWKPWKHTDESLSFGEAPENAASSPVKIKSSKKQSTPREDHRINDT